MKGYHIIIFLIFILLIFSLKYKEQFTIGSTEANVNMNNEITLEITKILDENTDNEREKQRNIKVREIKNTLENNINPGLSGNTDEIVYTLDIPTQISDEKINEIERLMYNNCLDLSNIEINYYDNNTDCYSTSNECYVLNGLDTNIQELNKMTSSLTCKDYFKEISVGGNCGENMIIQNKELRKICIPEHITDDYYIINEKLKNKSLSDFFVKLPKTFLSACFIGNNVQSNFIVQENILVYDSMIKIIFDLQSCYVWISTNLKPAEAGRVTQTCFLLSLSGGL